MTDHDKKNTWNIFIGYPSLVEHPQAKYLNKKRYGKSEHEFFWEKTENDSQLIKTYTKALHANIVKAT